MYHVQAMKLDRVEFSSFDTLKFFKANILLARCRNGGDKFVEIVTCIHSTTHKRTCAVHQPRRLAKRRPHFGINHWEGG